MLWMKVVLIFALAVLEVISEEGSGQFASGSGIGSLGDENPGSGDLVTRHQIQTLDSLSQMTDAGELSVETKQKDWKQKSKVGSKTRKKDLEKHGEETKGTPEVAYINKGLDSLAAMASAYKEFVSFLSKQKQWKRTEIRKRMMSLPQILARLAPRLIASNAVASPLENAKKHPWPSTPYYRWKKMKLSQLFKTKKHDVMPGYCVGENELCDAGNDEQCCGYASYCIDYFGVSKCLTFIRLSSEDLHDATRMEQNNNYKKYVKALLDTARYQLKYGGP